MVTPPTLLAGSATWTERVIRYSQSIVHTLDVRSVGSRNRVCSCVPAMEEPTTRTALAPLALQNVDCSNTTTKSMVESYSSEPATCRHRGRPLISSEEYNHAPNFIHRRMAGRALADRLHYPRDRRA